MPHSLDKETVNRILHLHQVQGLSAAIIAQRFGYSAARIYNVIRRKATSNKQQAASVKQQA
jgi:transposase